MSESKKLTKTSSGHNAGLHTSEQFKESEKLLRKQHEEELKKLNISKDDYNSSTIYRTKEGKKYDAIEEAILKEAKEIEKKKEYEKQVEEVKKSKLYKEYEEKRLKELIELKNENFARYENDEKLENIKKNIQRKGDPMEKYIKSHKRNYSSSSTSSLSSSLSSSLLSLPKYNGPNIIPNRFNILPGYRWDGIDRSNGIEKRILIKVNELTYNKSTKYQKESQDL